MKRFEKFKTEYLSIIVPMFALLAISLVVLVKLSYSWLSNGYDIKEMSFQSYQIDSVVTVYQAQDSNYNGVPDLLSVNGYEDGTYGYTETDEDGKSTYTRVKYDGDYYTEKYDFEHLSTTLVLSADSEANLLEPVELKDLYPSRVYTFKYVLANYFPAENYIYLKFSDKTSIPDKEITQSDALVNGFQVRACKVNNDGTLTVGQWQQFKPLENILINSEELIIPAYGADGKGKGLLDIWLQIRFDPKADNTLKNQTVIFPDVLVVFTTESENAAASTSGAITSGE